jgi:hypothetical protein
LRFGCSFHGCLPFSDKFHQEASRPPDGDGEAEGARDLFFDGETERPRETARLRLLATSPNAAESDWVLPKSAAAGAIVIEGDVNGLCCIVDGV